MLRLKCYDCIYYIIEHDCVHTLDSKLQNIQQTRFLIQHCTNTFTFNSSLFRWESVELVKLPLWQILFQCCLGCNQCVKGCFVERHFDLCIIFESIVDIIALLDVFLTTSILHTYSFTSLVDCLPIILTRIQQTVFLVECLFFEEKKIYTSSSV